MKHRYPLAILLIFLTSNTVLAESPSKPILKEVSASLKEVSASDALLERNLEEELTQQMINEKEIKQIERETKLFSAKAKLGDARKKCQKSGGCAKAKLFEPNVFVTKPTQPNKQKDLLSSKSEDIKINFILSALTDKYAYFYSIKGRYQVGQEVSNKWFLESILTDGVVLKKMVTDSGHTTTKKQTILFNW